MKTAEALRAVLKRAPLVSYHGTLFRTVDANYQRAPLSAIGSARAGGRFNPPGYFEMLYLSTSKIVAQLEIGSLFSSADELVSVPRSPELLLSVDVRLDAILDLTDETLLCSIETTRAELRSNWREYLDSTTLAPTHVLGIAIFAAERISAIRYASAKDSKHSNIAVLPQRLFEDEYLAIRNPGRAFGRASIAGTRKRS